MFLLLLLLLLLLLKLVLGGQPPLSDLHELLETYPPELQVDPRIVQEQLGPLFRPSSPLFSCDLIFLTTTSGK